MKDRSKMLFGALVACAIAGVLAANPVFAEDPASMIASDKAAIQAKKSEIKSAQEAARAEEKALKDQIRQAEQAGDPATAKTLKEQLKSMHKENVGEKKEDRKEIKELKKEFRADKKEARKDAVDTNDDGTIEKNEKKAFYEHKKKNDKDNNPPGPKGGPGTNWENRPGPKGGPGASPNRKGPR
ncbi:MAG: hypothetical protein HQL30_11730 [Candidatus Omnitrophica bacterium]|nr:hypothetical protein [Candidatus Omnitrophota bacterium]